MFNHVDICGLPGQVKIKVNNVEVPCKKIDFHAAVNEIPRVTMQLPVAKGLSGDLFCQTFFSFDEHTLLSSNAVLRSELLKKGDYYNGFLTSIESVLKEHNVGTNVHDLAVDIIDRLVGTIE